MSRTSARRAGSDAPALEAWEVFRQEKDGSPMTHGGSVLAPDPTLALHYAREMYSRAAFCIARSSSILYCALSGLACSARV